MIRGKESARAVARRTLVRVEKEGSYATLALAAELSRSLLDVRDRRLATELTYGVLRNRSRIDRALNAYARKGIGKLPPAALAVLRVAAYQVLFLERIPHHAAVDYAVSEMRSVVGAKLEGFANGLLRSLVRGGEPALPSLATTEGLSQYYSLPQWLMALLKERVGRDMLEEVCAGFHQIPSMGIRVNRQRISPRELAHRLEVEEGVHALETWLPYGQTLKRAGSPEESPSFADGLWTVQDTAAQAVCELVCPKPGERILDACAGVGGKTTALAELEPNLRIDAIDQSAKKLELLADTCARLGIDSIQRMVMDATQPDSRLMSTYDAVLLDAPCSGLGVLRRHPERKWQKGLRLAELVDTQRHLLDVLSQRVRVGGVLVYAVCTFTKVEGPGQIADFLSRHPEFGIERPPRREGGVDWEQLLEPDGSFVTWPHLRDCDAFYAVRLRRR